ncbi:type IV toxin-antitoxin system AbiEi family antitoxin domain-containing protein [Candidatus Palauibacter irciniicola]|uniref:type IV toxin-antitoxin system AbiEi family antitoxin domain-containing protein n=1 Tax=Candidatus Palauibacter irciniicola TaxID=3056733 RepID=UPI003B020430
MTYRNIISLSDTEASFLTTLAASGKQIFATKDAYDVLGEGKATRDALARLVDKGWLERLEKGKYLIVPLEAGPNRTWTEDTYVIAGHLVSHATVGYWSALNYWNLTEQIPRVTYVQTTARKERRTPQVLGMRFRIVRVKPRKFFGCHAYRAGQFRVKVTDREKTIIDCLDRPELSGGVAQVSEALLGGDGDFDWDLMTSYLRRFGSGAVVKRLGFLVESVKLTHAPKQAMLNEWLDLLTAGISRLDPSTPRKPHRIATRWRIEINLPEEGLREQT